MFMLASALTFPPRSLPDHLCFRWTNGFHRLRVFSTGHPSHSYNPYFYASILSLFALRCSKPSISGSLRSSESSWSSATFTTLQSTSRFVSVLARVSFLTCAHTSRLLYPTSHTAISPKSLHSIRTDALPFIWDFLSFLVLFHSYKLPSMAPTHFVLFFSVDSSLPFPYRIINIQEAHIVHSCLFQLASSFRVLLRRHPVHLLHRSETSLPPRPHPTSYTDHVYWRLDGEGLERSTGITLYQTEGYKPRDEVEKNTAMNEFGDHSSTNLDNESDRKPEPASYTLRIA